jgi:hypothetical protein
MYKTDDTILIFFRRYITHIANLQLFVNMGIEVTAVHRVLSFTQAAWLSPYIEFCSMKRAAAVSDFGRNYFKLLINALFGEFETVFLFI